MIDIIRVKSNRGNQYTVNHFIIDAFVIGSDLFEEISFRETLILNDF